MRLAGCAGARERAMGRAADRAFAVEVPLLSGLRIFRDSALKMGRHAAQFVSEASQTKMVNIQ